MLDIGERMRNKNFSPVHAQVVEVVKIRLVNNKISLYTQPNAGRTAQGSNESISNNINQAQGGVPIINQCLIFFECVRNAHG